MSSKRSPPCHFPYPSSKSVARSQISSVSPQVTVGNGLGIELGDAVVGSGDGCLVGPGVGPCVGVDDGIGVGVDDGIGVGDGVGERVGVGVGPCVGFGVGPPVGVDVGFGVGQGVGCGVGKAVGCSVGGGVGAVVVGANVGFAVVGGTDGIGDGIELVGPDVVGATCGASVVGTKLGIPVVGATLGESVVGRTVGATFVGTSVGATVLGAILGASVNVADRLVPFVVGAKLALPKLVGSGVGHADGTEVGSCPSPSQGSSIIDRSIKAPADFATAWRFIVAFVSCEGSTRVSSFL